MALAARLVDIHTHVYLPRYASLLRSRTTVPRILTSSRDGKPDDRLLILDHEPSGGRPVGPQYWDRDEKIKFMDRHGIEVRDFHFFLFLPAPQFLAVSSSRW